MGRPALPETTLQTPWTRLFELAHLLDAAERTRIGMMRRLDYLTRPVDERGKGVPAILPEVQAQYELARLFEAEERRLVKELEKAMAAHPLASFVKHRGCGLKSLARLLAVIGDPAAREMPSQLWAYCGLHVVDGKAPHRRPGQVANWNSVARSRAYLMAESCLKAGGPFRAVYDRARAIAETATDSAGEPLSKGHVHARAMRAMSKSILLHLWIEAREQAGLSSENPTGYLRIDNHTQIDTQADYVVDPLTDTEGEGRNEHDTHVDLALPAMPMIAAIAQTIPTSTSPRLWDRGPGRSENDTHVTVARPLDN